MLQRKMLADLLLAMVLKRGRAGHDVLLETRSDRLRKRALPISMKPRLYVETSVVSYLTALPSRDLVLAAHQKVTRDWWGTRTQFDLYVSQFVIDEASAGDESAAAARLAALREAILLDTTPEAVSLARELVRMGDLPEKALVDAFHIAIAAVHGMDYLLSWNCRHIANAKMRGRIETTCRSYGFEPPTICTPIELAKE
ncbi:MAG TPA: type II toxin-antitoxin system VapC family toxin [Thermoanaerobaculia bacterium]|nr:type II toxin-antitoxin system VapC family toxin [Thermoanaerobaculia bacterium]